jgi:hypothetical protein
VTPAITALVRYGIPATAPSFIPGFGAFVRMKAYPASAVEDARVGLAGPLWGLGASLAALGMHLLTGSGVWGAIAQAGAWINLLNLIPIPVRGILGGVVGSLPDRARVTRKSQRWRLYGHVDSFRVT